MLRIILFLVLLAALLIGFFAIMSALRAVGGPDETKGDTLPMTFQNIAYGLLLILMFGVCIGWLGAA